MLGISNQNFQHSFFVVLSKCFVAIVLSVATCNAIAQQTATTAISNNSNPTTATSDIEEVIVSGSRGIIRTSIANKRNADVIEDSLSAEDIGDLPALSIGEALENLTGASSHREQGGATEISIRGLGPYLGSTVINGRIASNGSGDRSVNFSQFPSELFNKVAIRKTQAAKEIEGGVSGVIELSTLKPLDYGKVRTQIGAKLGLFPDEADINNSEVPLTSRVTASHINSFDFGTSEFGFSVGLQSNIASNPEQEFRTSSAWAACRESDLQVDANCSSSSGINALVNSDGSLTADDIAGVNYVFVPSAYHFRQNVTDDDRLSFFTALQYRTGAVDVNLDVQVSNRTFTEQRNDLSFTYGRRIDTSQDYVITNNSFDSFSNQTRMETNSQYQERIEEYNGFGLNIDVALTEKLTANFDIASSETSRRENIYQIRLRNSNVTIGGEQVSSVSTIPVQYQIAANNSDVPLLTITNYDVTNHDLFFSEPRIRIDLNQARDNAISAIRADFTYDSDSDFFRSFEAGIRVATLDFTSFPRTRKSTSDSDNPVELLNEFSTVGGGDGTNPPSAYANQECRTEFPESGFLSSVTNGQNIITNVDSDGNVIESGTGNSYASFDARCLISTILKGDLPSIPQPTQNISNVDVEENSIAFYGQANFNALVRGTPIRGNFGIRIINTQVNSTGLRTSFTVVTDADDIVESITSGDDFTTVVGGGEYTEILPSFNLVVDYNRNTLMRGAIYRGLSRPDPAELGYGRDFSVASEDDAPSSISDFAAQTTANGNPFLQPFVSWNVDFAVEWYPNADSILAAGIYYKSFQGGFENIVQNEVLTINNTDINAAVATVGTTDELTQLYGFELTAAHRFQYLPGILKYFGAKLSYNYAESDFEFEHGRLGAATIPQTDGTVVERVALTPPANLFGFSKNVLSMQTYFQKNKFDVKLIYKYRSHYFQQFVTTPDLVRYIGDTGVWELKAKYKISKVISVEFSGINIFDEPRIQYNPTLNNLSEVNVYGPRYFLGLRAKF